MLIVVSRLKSIGLLLCLSFLVLGCDSSGDSDDNSNGFFANGAFNGQGAGGFNDNGLDGGGGPRSPGPGTGVPNPFNPGGGGGPLSDSPPSSVVLQGGGAVVLDVGDTLPLQVSVTLEDGTVVEVNSDILPQAVTGTFDGVELTFESLDPSIVSINSLAIMTGVGPGNTAIKVIATTNGGDIEVEVPVTVGAPLAFFYLANPTPNGGGGWIAPVGIFEGGALSALGPQIPNGGRPLGIFRSPDGRFVYAVNVSGDDITPYEVTQGTGALTRIGTDNIPAGDSPRGLVFTPDQAFAYTNNFNGDVLGYEVESDGMLTPLGVVGDSGSSFGISAINPAGNHLYTVNSGSDTIGIFGINGDGTLNAITSVASNGVRPFEIAFAPNHPFAYVTNSTSGTVTGFQVTGGNLTPLPSGPVTTGGSAFSLSIHPTLPVLYSVSQTNQTIKTYQFDTVTGALTEIDQDDSGTEPGGPIVDPTGSFVYIARGDYDLSFYTIDAIDGTLTRGPDFDDPVIENGFARTGVIIDNTFNKVVEIVLPEHELYPR